MNNNPSKHHYVPICYLKAFVNFQNQMWKRNKNKPKVSSCTPSQICYEINYYTLQQDETLLFKAIEDKYIIEKEAFKKQENKYRKILSNIVKYSPVPRVIDKADYRLFLEFLITLKRRNPFVKNHLISSLPEKVDQDFKKADLRDFLIKMCKEVGDEDDVDAYLKDYSTDRLKDPKKINDVYLSGFIDIPGSIVNNIVHDIYRFKQILLFAPIGTQFVTSDNPGFTIVGDQIIAFGGFIDQFQFYLPLSPMCCLLINSLMQEENSLIEKTIYPVFLDSFTVNQINNFTKLLSNKSIFSASKFVLEGL